MSKLRITLYKLCPVQAQAVQENAKRPRAGCTIQLKWFKTFLAPTIGHIKIMIHIRKFTVINILG